METVATKLGGKWHPVTIQKILKANEVNYHGYHGLTGVKGLSNQRSINQVLLTSASLIGSCCVVWLKDSGQGRGKAKCVKGRAKPHRLE